MTRPAMSSVIPERPHTPVNAPEKDRRLAETVRTACLDTVMYGYEEARMSGLCREGAWEAAVGALRMLDMDRLLSSSRPAADRP